MARVAGLTPSLGGLSSRLSRHCKIAIERGADVNAQGSGFGSALGAATAGEHTEVMQMLLGKGADDIARDIDPQFNIHVGHPKVVQMFIDIGADIRAFRDQGSSMEIDS